MNFSPSHWRLIKTSPAPGAWNMAVDEAILEAVGKGEAPATLRLYAWEPPCLSLGVAQPVADADPGAIEAYRWGLVRRPTGGRAILHTDELTYSICAPMGEPRLAGGVLQSYRVLSQALLNALRYLGVEAVSQEISPAHLTVRGGGEGDSDRGMPDPVCFSEPSNYEITVGGKKLIGSAQARRKDAILQHGSLPLCGDLTRIVQVLRYPTPEDRQASARRVVGRALTMEQALGSAPTWDDAARAFCQAFSDALNLVLVDGELSSMEQSRIARLVNDKYASPTWTGRV
jgi:lipoate-protein ligase A